MHFSSTQFKIDQIRKDKMTAIQESITLFILALFVMIFGPQLLFQYVFANQQLTEEPAIFQYITPVSFGLAVLYFLYVFLANMARSRKIKQLEKEMELMAMDEGCACGGNCGHHHHAQDQWSFEAEDEDVDDLEMVEFVDLEEEAEPVKSKKASKSTKSSKKSSKK